jgi:hypothetical protein
VVAGRSLSCAIPLQNPRPAKTTRSAPNECPVGFRARFSLGPRWTEAPLTCALNLWAGSKRLTSRPFVRYLTPRRLTHAYATAPFVR